MADEMKNKTTPEPGKGVAGIGDTTSVHYKEYDMNLMNDPVSAPIMPKERAYTKGQSKSS
jgi:hypothetical protein